MKTIEANRFKVEFKLQLNKPIKLDGEYIRVLDGKCQGKYDAISIKESSEFNPHHSEAKDLTQLIDVEDYLVNQPMQQFDGAVGYAAKI